MKMSMLLLLFAVTVLLSPAVTRPAVTRPAQITTNINLNEIINDAELYNRSLTKDYVDDVSHLAAGRNGCQDVFFCKVYDILHKHKHFGGSKEKENKLVGNLKQFTHGFNEKCEDLIKKVTPNGVTIPVPTLLTHLVSCSRNRNFNGTVSSS